MLHKAFLTLPFLVILYCVFRAYRLNRGWHCAYCGNSDALHFHPTCNLFDHPSSLASLCRLNHLRIMFRPGTLLLHCLSSLYSLRSLALNFWRYKNFKESPDNVSMSIHFPEGASTLSGLELWYGKAAFVALPEMLYYWLDVLMFLQL